MFRKHQQLLFLFLGHSTNLEMIPDTLPEKSSHVYPARNFLVVMPKGEIFCHTLRSLEETNTFRILYPQSYLSNYFHLILHKR